jgi:hypothetical protein
LILLFIGVVAVLVSLQPMEMRGNVLG